MRPPAKETRAENINSALVSASSTQIQARQTIRTIAWLPAIFIASALAAVWMLEFLGGIAPCKLCTLARIPYYLALLPAGVAVFSSARQELAPLTRACFGLISIAMAVTAAISIYHTGVEWELWVGPDSCSGTGAILSATTDDLLQQLQATALTCDAPGFAVLGVSLAAWNGIFSSVVAALAWRARKYLI